MTSLLNPMEQSGLRIPPYGILSDDEGYKAESELGACYVFRFEPGTGNLTIVTDEMIYPNGLAFSPDETVLYVADTSSALDPKDSRHFMAFDVVDGQETAKWPRFRGDRTWTSRWISRRRAWKYLHQFGR